MSINGLQALKASADSVKWSGALVLFSLVDLNLRVVTFDESGITLAGTIHIVVQDPSPTPADPAANPMAKFVVPLTYTVPRGGTIPGTTVNFVGTNPAEGNERRNAQPGSAKSLCEKLFCARADGESRGAYCSRTNSGVPRQNAQSGYRSR